MNTIGNITKNFTLPPRGKQLLHKLQSNELTTKEFDLSCAEWMLENIDDYGHHPEPTPPEELKEYFRKRKEDYKFNVNPEFFKQPHILSYMISSSAISTENKKNLFWLTYMKNVIPVENEQAHKKIDEKLLTHNIHNHILPVISKAKEIFGAGLSCPKEHEDPDSDVWNY